MYHRAKFSSSSVQIKRRVMKFSECAKVDRSQKRGHHWMAIVPFSIQYRWDRQKKKKKESLISNWEPCVLSASLLGVPEILVVCGFPPHSLINFKIRSRPEPVPLWSGCYQLWSLHLTTWTTAACTCSSVTFLRSLR